MTGLRELHLQSDYLIQETYMSRCVGKMLQYSTLNLKEMTVHFGDAYCWDTMDNETRFDWSSIEGLANLQILNIYGAYNADIEDLREVSVSLPRLERLFYSMESLAAYSERLDVIRCRETGVRQEGMPFPNLQMVETDDEELLRCVLSCTEATELYIHWQGMRDHHRKYFRGILGNLQILQEVHLKVRNWSGDDRVRCSKVILVELIRSLPKSVVRLAIRVERENCVNVDLSDKNEDADIIQALNHLVNLERLILPAECKATVVAQNMVCSSMPPTLERVYFRYGNAMAQEEDIRDKGLSGRDVTPFWFDIPEEEVASHGFSCRMNGIKITREPIVDLDGGDIEDESDLVKYEKGVKIKADIITVYMPRFY